MSKLGNELIESMQEVLAHVRGEKSGVRVYRVSAKSGVKVMAKKAGKTRKGGKRC